MARSKTVLAYTAATVVAVLFASAIPTAAYLALTLYTTVTVGDFGGPLNFVLIPLASAGIGALAVATFVPLAAIARRFRGGVLLLPCVIGVGAFAGMLAWGTGRAAEGSFVLFLAGFVALWLASTCAVFLAALNLLARVLLRQTLRTAG